MSLINAQNFLNAIFCSLMKVMDYKKKSLSKLKKLSGFTIPANASIFFPLNLFNFIII